MQINIYDTYVRTPDGNQMHFDVLTPDLSPGKARKFATEWLGSIGLPDTEISLERCQFCHAENSATPEIEREIADRGYFILQMEGCPSPIF